MSVLLEVALPEGEPDETTFKTGKGWPTQRTQRTFAKFSDEHLASYLLALPSDGAIRIEGGGNGYRMYLVAKELAVELVRRRDAVV